MKTAFLALLLAAPLAAADGPVPCEVKVRVALALAAAQPAPPAVAARAAAKEDACGTCREDLDAVRAECQRTGRPFVVFVGGCRHRGADVEAMGATPVRAKVYAADESARADAPRIVVVGRVWGKLAIEKTLPASADLATIRGHVQAVLPRMPEVGEMSPQGKVVAVKKPGCWAVMTATGQLAWYCPYNGDRFQ